MLSISEKVIKGASGEYSFKKNKKDFCTELEIRGGFNFRHFSFYTHLFATTGIKYGFEVKMQYSTYITIILIHLIYLK